MPSFDPDRKYMQTNEPKTIKKQTCFNDRLLDFLKNISWEKIFSKFFKSRIYSFKILQVLLKVFKT